MGILPTYKVFFFDTAGVLKYEVTDFVDLFYQRVVGLVGLAAITLPNDHPVVSNIGHLWRVEIWRKDAEYNLDWYREYSGLYRDIDYASGPEGKAILTCQDDKIRLKWRFILWAAGKTNRTEFRSKKAETIMKVLADYNAGPNATTGNGRIRTGSFTGLTIETDGANGNTLDWNCAHLNLLDQLYLLSRIGGGDYDLVKTGAAAWQFKWYTGQLGSDRSSTVIFSEALDNMADMRYRTHRVNEVTVVAVGGGGEGDSRVFEVRTGPNYSASYDPEGFVDARDVAATDTTTLQKRGDAELQRVRAIVDVSFRIIQQKATRYGVHYNLGDLVTVVDPQSGSDLTQKIVLAEIAVDADRHEDIQIGTQDT